jgi:uncharacterized protein YqfB (UPF0267 family)
MNHDLKIEKAFYMAAVSGDKTFEIRNNKDRGFQKGDTIKLIEIDELGLKTRREVSGVITYVINYAQQPDYVVFAFKLDCWVNP